MEALLALANLHAEQCSEPQEGEPAQAHRWPGHCQQLSAGACAAGNSQTPKAKLGSGPAAQWALEKAEALYQRACQLQVRFDSSVCGPEMLALLDLRDSGAQHGSHWRVFVFSRLLPAPVLLLAALCGVGRLAARVCIA